jgi:hypothetical protein
MSTGRGTTVSNTSRNSVLAWHLEPPLSGTRTRHGDPIFFIGNHVSKILRNNKEILLEEKIFVDPDIFRLVFRKKIS